MNKRDNLIGCHSCNRFSYLSKKYYDYLKPKKCKYCDSIKVVQNGFTRSRTNKEIISKNFLCKDCKKVFSLKLTGP
jgi:transposase-like protein